ncbi:MAG TPA: DnaB-like helicase C-terminal domain-containing protein [Verrucomicrobiota bacterium]|nr:DnaB-like helicase C-terminal domain-containing protein [Verrucomicrobiota bacterium]
MKADLHKAPRQRPAPADNSIIWPSDLATEKAVIGCVLQDPDKAADLRPDWFFDARTRAIASEMVSLANAGKRPDEVSLVSKLRAGGLDAPAILLNECDRACPSAVNFATWAETLAGLRVRRQIIRHGLESIAAAQRPDRPDREVLEDFQRNALEVRLGASESPGEVDLRRELQQLSIAYERAAQGILPDGIRTGFSDLDRILGYLPPQSVCLVAARPGVGKTSFALNVAAHVALHEARPVGFVSLEMAGGELLNRLVCARASVDSAVVRRGELNAAEIKRVTAALGALASAPLHFYDGGGLTLSQLSAAARRMVQAHKVELLIVDYLGLLRSGERGQSRYEETTTISSGVKALAKELRVPVILLAQLNRASVREGRAPGLADLRDSGALEQDADSVVLLHKDGEDANPQPVRLTVAKNRSGPAGAIDLLFWQQFTRFDQAAKGDVVV